MCDSDAKLPNSQYFAQQDDKFVTIGSRRRRLWDLQSNCHCPVIGVCLPLATLRKLTNKVLGGEALADDYEIHVGAVAECVRRNRLSEALQDELDRRYIQTIQRFKSAKTTEALVQLWHQAIANGDVSGAFWAGLTHPCCQMVLQEAMCRDMHMLQHQAGASVRVDLVKFAALQKEKAAQTQEYDKANERSKRLLAEKNNDIEKLNTQLVQAHATRISKDTHIASLQSEVEEWKAATPELESRMRLKQKNEQMLERNRELERTNTELKQKLAAAMRQLDKIESASLQAADAIPPAPNELEIAAEAVRLASKTVLCVGGRTGNVASYRAHIESIGGHFTHHDGGLEDNISLLDASLAAADLVICQTGCISHQAYWRVKDICKRTGKQCVFVDNPSASGLARGLEKISVDVTVQNQIVACNVKPNE